MYMHSISTLSFDTLCTLTGTFNILNNFDNDESDRVCLCVQEQDSSTELEEKFTKMMTLKADLQSQLTVSRFIRFFNLENVSWSILSVIFKNKLAISQSDASISVA